LRSEGDLKLSALPARAQRDGQAATYFLSLAGCPIAFESQTGGRTELQPTDSTAGFVSLPRADNRGSLSISFSCVQKAAKDYCPTIELKEEAEEPSTWKVMNVQRYAPVNSRYGGVAFAENLTAVAVPRPRKMSFCFGDDRRTLIGDAMIGNERRDVAPTVLSLLRTVRFSD
jgi:2-polyprenyl-6-methoxyphenol hydroxylase-like FAD-dependent oxidoreductase